MDINAKAVVRRAALVLLGLAFSTSTALAAAVAPDQNVTTGFGTTEWNVRNNVAPSAPFSGSCTGAPGLGFNDATDAADDGDAYDDAWSFFIDGAFFVAPPLVDLTGTTYTAGPVAMSGLNVSVE